jgi:hypothetical protein
MLRLRYAALHDNHTIRLLQDLRAAETAERTP